MNKIRSIAAKCIYLIKKTEGLLLLFFYNIGIMKNKNKTKLINYFEYVQKTIDEKARFKVYPRFFTNIDKIKILNMAKDDSNYAARKLYRLIMIKNALWCFVYDCNYCPYSKDECVDKHEVVYKIQDRYGRIHDLVDKDKILRIFENKKDKKNHEKKGKAKNI